MSFNHFCYRDFLKSEFEARLSKNAQYSMRAFARDLTIAPQMLSSVIAKKKDLSVDSAANIVSRLGLSPDNAQNFIDAVILSGCKTTAAKEMILQRIEDRSHSEKGFSSLNHEVFKIICDWYHIAILELIQTKDFKSDHRWIANRLGITSYEAKEAISRMQRLELIEEVNGVLKRTEFNLSLLSNVPNAALREVAKQILTKAIQSLDDQEQSERDITTITMSIDPNKLPEAKKMIAHFRRKLCKFLEDGQRKEVYVFSPVLFRLTNPKGKI